MLLCFLPLVNLAQNGIKARLIPGGTYHIILDADRDSGAMTVGVQPFYVTNEVTNKEYREFISYLKTNPADSLSYISLDSASHTKGRSSFIISFKNRDILKDIIDTTLCPAGPGGEPYHDYFSAKKYNDYAVVGISYENAHWYCVWKNMVANREAAAKGEVIKSEWRLPGEIEWLCMASGQRPAEDSMLRSVRKGKTNRFGVRNLEGNVAEWAGIPRWSDYGGTILTPKTNLKAIRGGSYKGGSITKRVVVSQSHRNNFTGFRMVKTYQTNDSEDL